MRSFPEAQIYCFVHREGQLLGHIEQRKIISSYLSRRVTNDSEFYKFSYQFPGIAKNFLFLVNLI